MSAPLSSDALHATVTPGKQPVLVTEYMPGGPGVQVINTAVTGTIYLGTGSNVQESNGVPVPAGSSVQWIASGQLWAVAGSDATGPMLLIASGLISSWAPSPEVIATAVATQLIAKGIPSVLVTTPLPVFNDATPQDVHGFASLTVRFPGAAAAFETQYYFTDSTGNPVGPADTIANGDGGAMIPVLGDFIVFPSLLGQSVQIDGSNRPLATTHAIVNGYSSDGWTLTIPSRTWVAGDLITFTTVKGQPFQGPAFAYLTISGTVVTGDFEVATPDGAGFVIADTGELHTAPQNRAVSKMLALPANLATASFHCAGTGGVAGCNAYLIPAY